MTCVVNIVNLTGTVAVTRNGDGRIEAVSFTSNRTEYDVVLSVMGRKLGEEMDGKEVVVTGTAREVNGSRSLWVKAYWKTQGPDDDGGWGELDPDWEYDFGFGFLPAIGCDFRSPGPSERADRSAPVY